MEYGNEKPEVTAVSFDPTFSQYLYKDYLPSSSDTKLADDVFLRRYYPGVIMDPSILISMSAFMILHLDSRNKRKQGGNDDSPASLKKMDNVMFSNGLECKISCRTSKVHTFALHNLQSFFPFVDTIKYRLLSMSAVVWTMVLALFYQRQYLFECLISMISYFCRFPMSLILRISYSV
jgi:hypothetical protein